MMASARGSPPSASMVALVAITSNGFRAVLHHAEGDAGYPTDAVDEGHVTRHRNPVAVPRLSPMTRGREAVPWRPPGTE